MKIEHITIWAKDIEKLRHFYEKYFFAQSSDKYINPVKKFSSYFLHFGTGTKIEIMQMDSVKESPHKPEDNIIGYSHFAISVGNRECVDILTATLKNDGYTVLTGPGETGNGYYELLVLYSQLIGFPKPFNATVWFISLYYAVGYHS